MVCVEGQVVYPGEYVLLSRTETISDVIRRAGGFIDGAAPDAARLYRRAMNSDAALPSPSGQMLADAAKDARCRPSEAAVEVAVDLERALERPHGRRDLMLLDGDRIVVPKENRIVHVVGGVLFPKAVQHVEGKSAGYYVALVGGYVPEARKRDTVIVYSNGEVKKARRMWFFSREVKPGSMIYVPVKGATPANRFGMAHARSEPSRAKQPGPARGAPEPNAEFDGEAAKQDTFPTIESPTPGLRRALEEK